MNSAEGLFAGLRAVSLDEMNERAALQRRTDNTYLVPVDDLAELVGRVGDEHEVLVIDGDRVFDYESTYFDTPSLRCFHDHVRDRRPRFKARTRWYVSTGDCFFEVKVKQNDGETRKRNVDYDPDDRNVVVPSAHDLLQEVLGEHGLDEPDAPEPSLVTAFRRVTVVARERSERTTFDFHVAVRVPDGESARLETRYAIAETKTAEGDGAWDRALAEAGHEPISLSKYRIGAGILHAQDDDRDYAREVKRLFHVPSASR
jgi:hypothetical protein